jgi:Family of unknown function (DUF5684)
MGDANWTLFAQLQQVNFMNGTVWPVILLAILVADLAIVVIDIAAIWKVFQKAGLPGWGVLIPFYNVYLFLKVAGRPGWWLILFLIPLVNVVIWVAVSIDIAKNFGKGAFFGLGLLFLGYIFYPVLGFSDDRYQPVVRL